jgi:hypothetical protein
MGSPAGDHNPSVDERVHVAGKDAKPAAHFHT